MYSLDTSVQINQASFNIRNKGDYRMVLDCFEALNDTELTQTERIYSALMIFYEDFNSLEDLPEKDTLNECIIKMFEFFNQGNEFSDSNTQDFSVMDWEKDSNLIVSAVNSVANQEIRSLPYLHWWTFLSYYVAIGECLLSHVITIRLKIAKNEKLEKHEKEFRQNNPQYFNMDLRSLKQKEADDYIRQLWGDG